MDGEIKGWVLLLCLQCTCLKLLGPFKTQRARHQHWQCDFKWWKTCSFMIRACLAVLIFHQAVLSGTRHESLARAGTLQLSSCLGDFPRSPHRAPVVVSASWAGPFQDDPLLPSFPCQQQTVTSVHEDVEKLEPSYADGGNVNCAATVEKSLEAPQKVKSRVTV